MRLLLRMIASGLYAYGGWSVACGIRGRDDPILHLGLGLIGAGLVIELVRNLWRAARRDSSTGDAAHSEPGAAADGGGTATFPDV